MIPIRNGWSDTSRVPGTGSPDRTLRVGEADRGWPGRSDWRKGGSGTLRIQKVEGRVRAMPLDLSSMMPERLAALDALVERSREVLDAASQKARAMIQTGEEFGWEFVSLGPLPEGIESAGLFVLPGRSSPTPHRHPNSIQHMRRLSGEARVRLTLGDEVLDRSVGADEPWVVIEADATHQIEVGEREFVVISFHTVPQEVLLEVTETGQRRY